MNTDDVVAVLQRAKERVAGGWSQTDINGVNGTWCAGMAIWKLSVEENGNEMTTAAQRLFARSLPPSPHSSPVCIFVWNDAPGRTQAEVLDAFDAAIRLAKEEAA